MLVSCLLLALCFFFFFFLCFFLSFFSFLELLECRGATRTLGEDMKQKLVKYIHIFTQGFHRHNKEVIIPIWAAFVRFLHC